MSKELEILQKQLGKLLNGNQARLGFLAGMLLALLKVKTVNLAELARAFISKAEESSRYRRIQRFLKEYELSEEEIAKVIMQMMERIGRKKIILDRTEWKFGPEIINILVLAVQYGGVAVPLLWQVMERRGNSDTPMRIELIEKYVKLFGSQSIEYVTGDREFIGIEWIGYLQEQGIDFRIRIKKDAVITHNDDLIDIQESLEPLTQEQPRYLTDCTIYGHHVNLSATKLKNHEYLLLIGNDNPQPFREDYQVRWDIEELFGCLKSRGFNFEDTHLTEPHKISKMMAILTIAFIWAVQTGQWLNQIQPITKKKTLKRPLKSIFRYGLDKLQDVLLNIHHGTKNWLFFEFALKFLSCT